MTRRKAWAAAALLIALGLSACARQMAVRIPSPPEAVRRDLPLSPAGEPKVPPPEAEKREAPSPAASAPGAAPPEAPPAPPPAEKPPEAPPPDYERMYAEAIARTKEAIARGKAAEAIPHWKALEDSPLMPDAVYHQGVLLHIAGELDNAVSQYRRVLSFSPGFEPAAANLLGVHLLRGEREAMISLVSRLLPAGTEPPPEMLPDLQANLASALLEMGRMDEAALLFLSLEARGTVTPAAPWNLAVLAFRKGDRETARKLAGGLHADVANLYPIVASKAALARESESIPVLDPVPAGQPRLAVLARNLAAYSEYRKGNLEAAERILLQTAGGGGTPPELESNLGMLRMEMGKWKEARASLEKAVGENPGMPEGWLNLGIFLEVYEGNGERARECYKTYVKMNGFRSKEVSAWIGWLPGPSPSQSQP